MTRSDGAATVRKLAVPIALPTGRVGRGHLVPDLLATDQPRNFIRVTGGRRVKYGMIAFVGIELGAADLLARWEREVGPVSDRAAGLKSLAAYLLEVSRLRLGNVVAAEYSSEGLPRLRKLRDTPPAMAGPKPPE